MPSNEHGIEESACQKSAQKVEHGFESESIKHQILKYLYS
jgi:hypothetical protein